MEKTSFDRVRAVEKFQAYLRINTSHPEPDYRPAIKFLDDYAAEVGLDVVHVEVGEKSNVVLLMTSPGTDPSLPSLLLYSHMDAAPADPEQWVHGPWDGVNDDGNIYGRGSQDMKCVGVQYMEAIRALKEAGRRFKRTIHIIFMPDEQIGGFNAMKPFLQTSEFEAMNIGFTLDEGLANPGDKYSVFYAERVPWWIKIKCEGDPGHASQFLQNSAPEKLRRVVNAFLDFSISEEKRMKEKRLSLGEVCTSNLTVIEGGDLPNVIPDKIFATFDIRIPPTMDLKGLENEIERWCKEAGSDVTYEFLQKMAAQTVTDTTTENIWWKAFSGALKKMEIEFLPEIFPCFSDSRYLRELGFQAIGFSPMHNTPILIHQPNEYLSEEVFVEGITVYCELISTLADVPPH